MMSFMKLSFKQKLFLPSKVCSIVLTDFSAAKAVCPERNISNMKISTILSAVLFLVQLQVFSETNINFSNQDVIEKWNLWQSVPDAGKIDIDNDKDSDSIGCVRFLHVGRASASFSIDLPFDGSKVKFSFKAKDNGGKTGGAIAINAIIPGAEGPIKISSALYPTENVWNEIVHSFRLPQSGSTKGRTRLDILVNNSFNTIWLDDIKIMTDRSVPLWSASFNESTIQKCWTSYAMMGMVEGLTELQCSNEGYSNANALSVKHISGNSGYGASLNVPLTTSQFSGENELLLSAFAKVKKDAQAQLAVEQMDHNGKVIGNSIMKNAVMPNKVFQYIFLPFKLLPQTASIRPILINQKNSEVIFDDVSISRCGIAEKRLLALEKKAPLWAIVYPADFFAYIDKRPSDIQLVSGRALGFILMLAGDKELTGDTTVDFELPHDVELLSCQWSTYGTAPLKVEKLEGGNRYRVINPYDWKKSMMNGNPNHYMGMEIVVQAPRRVGKLGMFRYWLKHGDTVGETRSMPVISLEAPPEVPQIPGFSVGGASLISIHVADDNARRKLVADYIKHGVNISLIHENQKFAIKTAEELGMKLRINIHGPHLALVYRGTYDGKLPSVVLADDKELPSQVSFAYALSNHELRAAYKKYLENKIAMLPQSGDRFLAIDIEFWGTGLCTKSDFSKFTVEEFRKYAKLTEDVKLDSKTILEKYKLQWYAYRNDVTVRLHKMVKDIAHEIDPEVQLVNYAYSLNTDGTAKETYRTNVPTDCLAYDAADAVDNHGISTYNLEGVNFLDHIDCDAHTLKHPVFAEPYIAEALPSAQNPNWAYHHLSAEEVSMEILGAAASGAAGVTFFSGIAFDGERLCAISKGMLAVAKYADFYTKGIRNDSNVKLVGLDAEMRYRVHDFDGKRLLTLFNCGTAQRIVSYPGGTTTVPPGDFRQVLLIEY